MRQTSTCDGFFSWITERNRVWMRRNQGCAKPWTDDAIMQRYKFTNVFRELDTGTIALRDMLRREDSRGMLSDGLIVFNVAAYRMFNRAEHGRSGPWMHHHELHEYVTSLVTRGRRVFTGAHMHSGTASSNLRSLRALYDHKDRVADLCHEQRRLESVFHSLLRYDHIGRFIAYEIVCDLRFEIGARWIDVDTWCNIGPGSKRGLQRLGMPPTVASTVTLLDRAREYLPIDRWTEAMGVPFELREIEHSLCEFDKYERARLGEGAPKQRYDGA
jgi:hypothetical protein